ncbi:MAG: serine hydrolase [Candidatus Thorarchaeota archaeon]|nr:serine hydrolase [Candidatus Thorarchaeota archaeon]
MNSTKLDEMISRVYDEDMRVHSMIIVKEGYIVAEEYFSNTFSSNTTHVLYSATKSVTSILVGVAMQQGFLDNVSQKVLDFFPDRTFDNIDERKQAMTLEHLLTMRPGIEWDEWAVPYSEVSFFTNPHVPMSITSKSRPDLSAVRLTASMRIICSLLNILPVSPGVPYGPLW